MQYTVKISVIRYHLHCALNLGFERKGQANKGTWWMPRRQEATKDVVGCDKPRGAAKQALIRGFPNGATRVFGASRIRIPP